MALASHIPKIDSPSSSSKLDANIASETLVLKIMGDSRAQRTLYWGRAERGGKSFLGLILFFLEGGNELCPSFPPFQDLPGGKKDYGIETHSIPLPAFPHMLNKWHWGLNYSNNIYAKEKARKFLFLCFSLPLPLHPFLFLPLPPLKAYYFHAVNPERRGGGGGGGGKSLVGAIS